MKHTIRFLWSLVKYTLIVLTMPVWLPLGAVALGVLWTAEELSDLWEETA